MRILFLSVLSAVLTSLLFSPVASAKRVPCVLGQKSPKCLMWEAKVHLAIPATIALEKMVKNSHVRLVAQKASSKSIGDTRARLRRSFQVKRAGRWIDPSAELLRRGLVLPFPNGQECAWNGLYSRLAQQAALKGKGIWNPTSCHKPGPSQANPLRMKVKWDAPSVDKGERRVDPHPQRRQHPGLAAPLGRPRRPPPWRQAHAGLQVPVERRHPAE